MTPRSLLMSILVLSLFFRLVCTPTCQHCRFVQGFPVRLEKLREDYSQIKSVAYALQVAHPDTLTETNDDLDTALLDQSVEDSFNSSYACHAMNSILDFYLSTVLPTAMARVTDDTRNLVPHMESIQQIFSKLNTNVTKCMENKGLYKAMGELDLLFNYIERYLASQQRGRRVASA